MIHNLLKSFSLSFLLLLSSSLYADSKPQVGAILPLTGELAGFGKIARTGIESAKATATQIIYEDDSCLPEKSVNSYMRLASFKNIGIFLGPCCTTSVAALAPLIKKRNHVTINFCTGSEEAYKRSGGNIFHSQYSAQTEAAFNAKAMWEMGIRSPLIVSQESEFGLAHEKAFRKTFPNQNVKVLSYMGTDREQLKALILKMKSQDFDAVYVPLVETFLLGFMTEMNKAGIKGKKVFGIYSVEFSDVLKAEGNNSEGIIYSYPDISTTEDAATYFAKLAAEMIDQTVSKCGNDNDCIKKKLVSDYPFDEYGFLKSKLMLKTIKGGKFVNY